MNKKFYGLLICALFITAILVDAQQLISKTKNISSSSKGQKNISLNLSATQSLSSIGNNLNNFLSRNNVLLKKHQGAGTISSSNLFKLAQNSNFKFPQVDSKKNKNIGNVVWNKKSGTPRLIEMKSGNSLKKKAAASEAEQLNAAKNFLDENKVLLKIFDPQNEFKLKSTFKDAIGTTHIKFFQTYKGLNVWGKEIVVHLDLYGNIKSLNGNYEATPSIANIDCAFTAEDAVSKAISEIRKTGEVKELSLTMKKILNYDDPSAEKIIWFDKNHNAHLTWKVEIRSGLTEDWFYFIDANTSDVLNYYNNVKYDGPTIATAIDLKGVSRQIGTYQVGSNYYMMDASKQMFSAVQSTMPSEPIGVVAALDLQNQDLTSESSIYYVLSSNNQWNDPAAVSANFNAAQTYDYYLNNHNRNSIDGKGMTIYSIVHATDGGQSMENAFWSGKVMCYGDGGEVFSPLAASLDVAAHEMTHGITEYTAGLEYQNQSGALNESYSDVFGVLVDSSDWDIGEDIIKDRTYFPTGAMRKMSDPHNGGTQNDNCWQPATMSEFVQLANTENQDWGGVHINSGIPNFAFYKVAVSIGRHKAGKIWYRALTSYLTRQSDFIDARIATGQSAADLYGNSSTELQAVNNAWDAVEIFEGTGSPEPPTYEISGNNWVLVTNTDPNDPYSLYMCNPSIPLTEYSPLSVTSVSNRPAVTDASGIVLFIDNEKKLRALYADTDPNNIQEEVLSDEIEWGSVAAGPGLNSIAMTSAFQDTTIYYFDLVNGTYKTFKIVSTSFDGAEVKTALYADALSFDPSGEYILFDCYNEVKKSDGSTIDYWTINLLEIATGKIANVFPPQEEGINIGNPSFSKTSQNRFAFDYIDNGTNEVYAMAADFNTGDAGVVAGPSSVLAYPSYSGDDKKIVYHSAYSLFGWDYELIMQMPLLDDMITGTGYGENYLSDATYPCWFVIGTRTDAEEENTIPSGYSLIQNFPNPFNPTTNISYQLPFTGHVTLKVFDILGREVATLVNEIKNAGYYNVNFDARSLSSGIYIYKINAGNFTTSKKMLLVK